LEERRKKKGKGRKTEKREGEEEEEKWDLRGARRTGRTRITRKT
jgi:hypothetical protein